MAMVKFGGGIVEINGKQGGNIWRRDQCIQHMQKFPRQVNTHNPKQELRRRWFSKLIHHYIPMWATQEFVASWQQYAYDHPRVSRKYGIYTLTWWTQFLSSNINRVIAGEEPYRFPSEIP